MYSKRIYQSLKDKWKKTFAWQQGSDIHKIYKEFTELSKMRAKTPIKIWAEELDT